MRKKAQTIIIKDESDCNEDIFCSTTIKSYLPFRVIMEFYNIYINCYDDYQFNKTLKQNSILKPYLKKHDFYEYNKNSIEEFMSNHIVGAIKSIYFINGDQVSQEKWNEFFCDHDCYHYSSDLGIGCIRSMEKTFFMV